MHSGSAREESPTPLESGPHRRHEGVGLLLLASAVKLSNCRSPPPTPTPPDLADEAVIAVRREAWTPVAAIKSSRVPGRQSPRSSSDGHTAAPGRARVRLTVELGPPGGGEIRQADGRVRVGGRGRTEPGTACRVHPWRFRARREFVSRGFTKRERTRSRDPRVPSKSRFYLFITAVSVLKIHEK